jgi:hypothetical protein
MTRILLLILLVGSAGIDAESQPFTLSFKAGLSGGEEVPPVKTRARGEASFHFSEEQHKIGYTLSVTDTENPVGANIHLGKKGEKGPAVANLFAGPRQGGAVTYILAEGTIRSYQLIGPLQGKSIESLIEMMRNGAAYINVYTEGHPGGEIRGQILGDL